MSEARRRILPRARWGTSRGENYWGYDGTKKFDQPLWDRKEGNTLRVMWCARPKQPTGHDRLLLMADRQCLSIRACSPQPH